MKLRGACALVTGATGGLGAAIARALSAEGASLVLTGRQTDVLGALADELGARAVPADLADRETLNRLISEAGQVDVLVANAGLPADGTVDEYSVEQIDRALDVNLRAPILMAQALSAHMVERGSGHIVFVSSLSGKVATPGSALYSATKFGLRGFASGLRQDLHGSGVGVSTVLPGFIRDAGMFASADVKLPPGIGTRRPEDVARAVIRAIERDRAEVDVAPIPMRIATMLGSIAPALAATITRRAGGSDVSTQVAASEAHRNRR